MRIVNTLYNEPPDEIEQIVKMTDTEYEQIKSDRALLEEAVEIIKSLQDGLLPYENESGIMRVKLHCWRDLKSFLTRAKERLGK